MRRRRMTNKRHSHRPLPYMAILANVVSLKIRDEFTASEETEVALRASNHPYTYSVGSLNSSLIGSEPRSTIRQRRVLDRDTPSPVRLRSTFTELHPISPELFSSSNHRACISMRGVLWWVFFAAGHRRHRPKFPMPLISTVAQVLSL